MFHTLLKTSACTIALHALLASAASSKGGAISVINTRSGSNGIQRRQDSDEVPFKGNVCRLIGQSTVLVNNTLFVDWSYVTAEESVNRGFLYAFTPFTVDLSIPFKAKDLNFESEGVVFTQIPDEFPATFGGMDWAIEGTGKIYKFGGNYIDPVKWGFPEEDYPAYAVRSPAPVWELDLSPLPDKPATWTKLPVSSYEEEGYRYARNETAQSRIKGTIATAQTHHLGKGYFVGGLMYNRTDSVFDDLIPKETYMNPGVITYDIESNSFTNTSFPKAGIRSNRGPVNLGQLVTLEKFGEQGVLVLLGGVTSEVIHNHPDTYKVDDIKPASMEIIEIYDIETGTWYTQTTTGNIPEDRGSFCTVVRSAPDGSSHQIIIHGGSYMGHERQFGDTYILSIPSFTWVKADDDREELRKVQHTCHTTPNNKMIVIGGVPLGQSVPDVAWPEPYTNGECSGSGFVRILNLNTFEWEDELDIVGDGEVEYKVHEKVYEIIGGDENGGATMVEPEGGWSAEALGDILWVPKGDGKPSPSRTPTDGPSATDDAAPTETTGSGVSPRVSNALLGGIFGMLSMQMLGLQIF